MAENTAARVRAPLCCAGFAAAGLRLLTGPLHVARHPIQVVSSSRQHD